MVPKVVQELVASFHRTDVNIDDITDKVGHDQVLTARVLRLANTARFGGAAAWARWTTPSSCSASTTSGCW